MYDAWSAGTSAPVYTDGAWTLKAVATDAALLLRQAERAVGAGVLQLVARPAVADHIAAHPAWIAMLQNRSGRPVEIAVDAAIKGVGHAQ